jgi:tRNA threonylcarbamoyladenosine biosynthesis protein TsaE
MLSERVTSSEEETEAFAAELARTLKPCVLLLEGELGAGKTTFTRGFVSALPGGAGVTVQSPTFALARTYPTTPPVHHLDLYRLETGVERALIELGLMEMLTDENAFALVEWPRDLQLKAVRITIEDAGGDSRRIKVSP